MTTVKGQLLHMLQTVAPSLGDELRERLVFVGGCTTALFITDEIVLEGVRATDDVDLIVDLVGHAQWAQLQDPLRQKGFVESPEDRSFAACGSATSKSISCRMMKVFSALAIAGRPKASRRRSRVT
ncbi:hypothetical protein [Bradyrhizobium sp. 162]|uniref:hypothetical protein n=1 Tax=Bradyrhizobium sp. 162 TaxID=2782635 RepID=UPI00320988E9